MKLDRICSWMHGSFNHLPNCNKHSLQYSSSFISTISKLTIPDVNVIGRSVTGVMYSSSYHSSFILDCQYDGLLSSRILLMFYEQRLDWRILRFSRTSVCKSCCSCGCNAFNNVLGGVAKYRRFNNVSVLQQHHYECEHRLMDYNRGATKIITTQ